MFVRSQHLLTHHDFTLACHIEQLDAFRRFLQGQRASVVAMGGTRRMQLHIQLSRDGIWLEWSTVRALKSRPILAAAGDWLAQAFHWLVETINQRLSSRLGELNLDNVFELLGKTTRGEALKATLRRRVGSRTVCTIVGDRNSQERRHRFYMSADCQRGLSAPFTTNYLLRRLICARH